MIKQYMSLVWVTDACIGIPFQVSFDGSIWGHTPVSPVSQTQTAAKLPSCGEVSGTTSMTRSLGARQVLRDTCMTSHLYNYKCLLTQTCDTVIANSMFNFEFISKQSDVAQNSHRVYFYTAQSTINIARRVKLIVIKQFYYSHDFIVAVRNSCGNYIPYRFLQEGHYRHTMINRPVKPQLTGGAVLPKKRYKGRYSNVWSALEISPYNDKLNINVEDCRYHFVSYLPANVDAWKTSQPDIVFAQLPISVLVTRLSKPLLLDIANKHQLPEMSKHKSRDYIVQQLLNHHCSNCETFMCVFSPLKNINSGQKRMQSLRARKTLETCGNMSFPPKPASSELIAEVIDGFSKDISIHSFIESACAVCAQLVPQKLLSPRSDEEYNINLLHSNDPITRCERLKSSDPIVEMTGPILLPGCDNICQSCLSELKEGRTPADSLANGLWLGEVPPQLQNLSFTEKMLIARIKHNHCIVKVHMSGMSKLRANVVSHSLPMPKIYSVLPPRCEELSEVLAFLYLGPNQPTSKEYKRTPMLVRRNKVADALEWLKLNHINYADLEISYDNINSYPEDEPPVIVNYSKSMESNVDPEASAGAKVTNHEGAPR